MKDLDQTIPAEALAGCQRSTYFNRRRHDDQGRRGDLRQRVPEALVGLEDGVDLGAEGLGLDVEGQAAEEVEEGEEVEGVEGGEEEGKEVERQQQRPRKLSLHRRPVGKV